MSVLIRMRCVSCGYGVSVREPPAACPMCHGSSWEHERLLSTLAHDLLHLPHLPHRERVKAKV